MATTEPNLRSGQISEFEQCVSEYHSTMAELRDIEQRMTRVVAEMREMGAPRERLLAAAMIVGDLRNTLQASDIPPADERAQEDMLEHRVA